MPALGMTNTQIYCAAGALAVVVLLIGGSKVVYDNTDTGLAKSAFALSKLCQEWKRTDQAKYINCIRKLNLSLEKLKNRDILNVNECKPYPEDENSAICPIKGSGRIIVTLPEIVAQAKKKGVTKRSVDKKHGLYPPSQGDVSNLNQNLGSNDGVETLSDMIKKKLEIDRKLRNTGKRHPPSQGAVSKLYQDLGSNDRVETLSDMIKKKLEIDRQLRNTRKSHPPSQGAVSKLYQDLGSNDRVETLSDMIKKKLELDHKLRYTGKEPSSGSS